jgi:SpoIIAA-like
MIRLLEGLPDHVIGFEAVGKVEAADYESVLDPAVDAAVAANDKIRLLYVLGEEFEGYSSGAMWGDAKLGLKNWTHFEKVAFVSDHRSYVDGVRAFGWLIPGEVKTFSLSESEAARTWVAG